MKCPADNVEVYVVIALCTFGMIVNSVGAVYMSITKHKTRMTIFVIAITLSDILFMSSTVGLNFAYLNGNRGQSDEGK